jgi:hypothetical protein
MFAAEDWERMGRTLRESSLDARPGEALIPVDDAYIFLLDNPSMFAQSEFDADAEWPADMPLTAPAALVAAYNAEDGDNA